MSKTKKVGLTLTIILALLIGSWGVVYASADHFVSFTPADTSYISDDKPTVTASWQIIPGVRLNSAKVIIDDKNVSDRLKISESGFSYTPSEPLTQGMHTVKAKLAFNMAIDRAVDYQWTFVVDTEPPALSLENGDNFVVSANADYDLNGQSEPGAVITAKLNDRGEKKITVGGDGVFTVNLTNLEDKNELRLAAADAVGNIRTVVIPVIRDETPPTISALSPGEGETVRTQSPKISVGFTEEQSGVKSMKLLIDSTTAITKEGSGDKTITYLGTLLSDGKHSARVEATDYAGHSVVQEWTFDIDSRKIVINRAERRLYFYRNGGLMKVYPIAVGVPQYPTPGGSFSIRTKERNPSWRNPGSEWAKSMPKIIPPGPDNPLGTRAMQVTGPVFIHGTYNAGSIGTAASHGCIRMYIRDVEELFGMVSIGIPVKIL